MTNTSETFVYHGLHVSLHLYYVFINTVEADDLKRHRGHYNVTVMTLLYIAKQYIPVSMNSTNFLAVLNTSNRGNIQESIPVYLDIGCLGQTKCSEK